MIGIILIIAGILGLAIPASTYMDREQVLDLGPIQATAERERTLPDFTCPCDRVDRKRTGPGGDRQAQNSFLSPLNVSPATSNL